VVEVGDVEVVDVVVAAVVSGAVVEETTTGIEAAAPSII